MMISKQEYLKRYLSADTTSAKKKRRHIVQKSRVKILDDDVDVKALIPSNVNNSLDDDICDDKPAVAEFVDERPDDVRELERFRESKQWKIVGQSKNSLGDNNMQSSISSTSMREKSGRHDSDSDMSPDRSQSQQTSLATGKDRNSSSVVSHSRPADTSIRKRRRSDSCSDSDFSPARHTGSKQTVSKSRSDKIRHDSDSDLSPSQQSRNRTCVSHTRADRNDSDSDQSPVRQPAEKSPNRTSKARYDSDSDLSPARRDRDGKRGDSKKSGRGSRHDSDSDLSPLRQVANRPAVGHSRSNEVRHVSNSDLSPDRRGRVGKRVDRIKAGRHDSDSDQNSDCDMSPVRHSDHVSKVKYNDKKASSHHSSHKKDHRQPDRQEQARHKNGLGSDQSPARRKNKHDGDLSPPRKKHSPRLVADNSSDRDLSPVRKASKTLSGAKAGLQSAADMKKESVELKRKEEEVFAKIGEDMLGRNAQAIVRDKSTGRKRNLVEEQEARAKEDAVKAARASKYEDWNKGLRQKAMQSEMLAEALAEVNKPLARYSDDADLDARLREQEREGDTMLAYIKKKKAKTQKQERPVYKGPEPPPNRFNIRPGYRWDGVDRSNGFEKMYFSKLSEKKAIKEIAYKWSVENM